MWKSRIVEELNNSYYDNQVWACAKYVVHEVAYNHIVYNIFHFTFFFHWTSILAF